MAAGLLDTNLFIHAQTRDEHSEECLDFLERVERGEIEADLQVAVLHELSYTLPRYRQGMSRDEVAVYLLTILAWDGIVSDRSVLNDAIERWRSSERLGFVDAYLAALAADREVPVYTKNIRDFAGQDIEVPDPLPL